MIFTLKSRLKCVMHQIASDNNFFFNTSSRCISTKCEPALIKVVSPLCLVSVSISNLYPGCENVSVRSRSMMFEPSLTKGVLEVFSPVHNALSTADEQATKAIDIQHASIHGENQRWTKCSHPLLHEN